MDLFWILGFVILGVSALLVIIEAFRYGANLERRNERTDLWGRPNNHMKDDMD